MITVTDLSSVNAQHGWKYCMLWYQISFLGEKTTVIYLVGTIIKAGSGSGLSGLGVSFVRLSGPRGRPSCGGRLRWLSSMGKNDPDDLMSWKQFPHCWNICPLVPVQMASNVELWCFLVVNSKKLLNNQLSCQYYEMLWIQDTVIQSKPLPQYCMFVYMVTFH